MDTLFGITFGIPHERLQCYKRDVRWRKNNCKFELHAIISILSVKNGILMRHRMKVFSVTMPPIVVRKKGGTVIAFWYWHTF